MFLQVYNNLTNLFFMLLSRGWCLEDSSSSFGSVHLPHTSFYEEGLVCLIKTWVFYVSPFSLTQLQPYSCQSQCKGTLSRGGFNSFLLINCKPSSLYSELTEGHQRRL